ncbi:MAG: ABC transporter substrate-binding protein [Betaproteobacteria bacterium]|nr:ABC transporter substrate-binding protein [Betaproteobacteria bacterium]
MTRTFNPLWTAWALCLAVLAAAPLQVQAQVKWRHGIVQAKADAGFFYMASEKGFFKARGLDVEFVNLRGNNDVTRALLAGELDSGEPSPSSPLAAIANGANIRFIGSSMPGLPFALFARKDIKNWQGLKGTTFAISAPGSITDVLARAMLKRQGVDPDSIKIANAGGSAGRIRALASGKVDATAASSEFIPAAEKLGIRIMGLSADIVPEYPRFVVVAKVDTLKGRREDVINFLAGYMEGLDYALKHREETLKLSARINDKPVSAPEFGYIYDEAKLKGYVSVTSEIPRDKIEWLQSEMLRLGDLKKKIDLDQYIDESFRTEALQRAKISSGR